MIHDLQDVVKNLKELFSEYLGLSSESPSSKFRNGSRSSPIPVVVLNDLKDTHNCAVVMLTFSIKCHHPLKWAHKQLHASRRPRF